LSSNNIYSLLEYYKGVKILIYVTQKRRPNVVCRMFCRWLITCTAFLRRTATRWVRTCSMS